MTRNEKIFYVGVGIVVLVAEIGIQYGVGCIASPLLLILAALSIYVFPLNQ